VQRFKRISGVIKNKKKGNLLAKILYYKLVNTYFGGRGVISLEGSLEG